MGRPARRVRERRPRRAGAREERSSYNVGPGGAEEPAALFFLDVDNALLLGLFAGISSILPFIGVFLATIPPLFFAYIKFQSGLMLLKVAGVFALIYFLEGYLVKPLVFKEAMNLNPLMSIIVVMICGELMGFWGILLAIPLAAALKILSIHWRRGDFRVPE